MSAILPKNNLKQYISSYPRAICSIVKGKDTLRIEKLEIQVLGLRL